MSCDAGLFLNPKETVLGLCISVREIFSNPIAIRDINKYAIRDVVRISRELLPDDPAGCQSVLSKRIFLDIYSNTFLGVRNFGNKSAMRLLFLSKMLEI